MDANELLMGGGVKSVKWSDHQIGHTVIGTITEPPKAEQMKKYQSTELDFWPSGDPKMQVVVTIQTDTRETAEDDGRRRLYIEPRMMAPVREAIQKAGAKGLEVGARIAVRWISGSGQGEGNARQYAAEYARPVVEVGSMLGDSGAEPANGATPAAAAPAQGSLLSGGGQPAELRKPDLVAQDKWDRLDDTGRRAVLAAMGEPVPF